MKIAKFYFLVIKNVLLVCFFITPCSGNFYLKFSCIASEKAFECFFKQNQRESAYSDKYRVCISQQYKSDVDLAKQIYSKVFSGINHQRSAC